MSLRTSCRGFTILTAVLLLARIGASAEPRADHSERLARGSELTVKALIDVKLQLLRTMDAYNALLPPTARDRQSIYKDLRREFQRTDKRLAKLSRKAEQMNARADKLFERWASSATAIQDPGLREQSERRLREARASYVEIRPVGQKATGLCEPFLKALRREIAALGKSLDAKSLTERQSAAKRLNAQADALVQHLDDQITATRASVSYLRS